jgi:hypothetical protein
MNEKSAASVLKEQFAMIAILVVLIGTVYTDAYYASFGLRYQSLNLPAAHIIYRGFTAVTDMPLLALPYLIGVFWLGFVSTATDASRLRGRIWISYLMLSFILAIAYPLTTYAGLRAAKRDLGGDSTLPRVKQLLPKEAASGTGCEVADACRLLLVDSDYLYVFVPQGTTDVPHIKRLDRRVFHEIDTGTE